MHFGFEGVQFLFEGVQFALKGQGFSRAVQPVFNTGL
jgi:hypothetical protein